MKKVNLFWGWSLMLIGVCTIIIAGSNIIGIELNDVLKRVLPYSWLYDSLTYRIVAILVPLLAFVLAIAHMTLFIPVMVIVVEIIMLFVFITPKSESCDK